LAGGAVEIAVVEHALVRDVLIDEPQTGRRVDDDVAHAVLADDAALKIAEARFGGGRFKRGGLFAQRRLNDTLFLKERRELGAISSRCAIETVRREKLLRRRRRRRWRGRLQQLRS